MKTALLQENLMPESLKNFGERKGDNLATFMTLMIMNAHMSHKIA
jgi:hypothetical protein